MHPKYFAHFSNGTITIMLNIPFPNQINMHLISISGIIVSFFLIVNVKYNYNAHKSAIIINKLKCVLDVFCIFVK